MTWHKMLKLIPAFKFLKQFFKMEIRKRQQELLHKFETIQICHFFR